METLYQKQQIQRALCVIEMVEKANRLLRSLKKDLSHYDNMDHQFDKTRLILDRSWIVKQISKYERVEERLMKWCNDIMKKASVNDSKLIKEPAMNSLYCFAPSNNTSLNEAGIVRFIGHSKSGKLLKFEFVNYLNKQGTKFNLFFVDRLNNLQKIA